MTQFFSSKSWCSSRLPLRELPLSPSFEADLFFRSRSFLTVSSGSKQVFTYFVALVTIFGALTWMSILVSHIRFMQALKAQGIPRASLPYIAPLQPYFAWFALIT